MCCVILYWQERSQAADLLRQFTLDLAAPSYNKIILRKISAENGALGGGACVCSCAQNIAHT